MSFPLNPFSIPLKNTVLENVARVPVIEEGMDSASNQLNMGNRKKLPEQCLVLKGLRGREGISQEQLAKKLDVSRTTISQMETGKREISSEDAKKLAKALKTKPRMFD